MGINKKVVVITGASSGLGEDTAICLSKLGAEIVLVARSRERLEKVQKKIKEISQKESLIIECDISSEDDVSKMAEVIEGRYTHVDVLINNAGIGKYVTSEEMSNEEMRQHFEVNVFGTYYCIKALLPLMKNRPEGYILNVASLFSLISFSDVSVYAATKFALAGLTKGLRQEFENFNIKVGLLMPASIDTPFQNKKQSDRKSPKFMILKSEAVANEIAKMIKSGKKELILPKWITPLIRLKCLFS